MSAPVLDARATADAIDVRSLVDALAHAAIEFDDGAIVCPDRIVLPMDGDAVLMSMPAAAADVAIHKLITVAPRNGLRGLPTILGSVTVLDPSSGRVLAVLDGPTVTGRRTAAISMLAIERLATRLVDGILLIGTGTQARHHLAAIVALHPSVRVRVRGTSVEAALRFCADQDARVVDLAPAAADESCSVVITCTSSRTAVYGEAARADRLVVAVGSFQPAAAEIAPATVLASAVFVDDPSGAPHEAGDLIQAGVDWTQVVSLATLLRDPGTRAAGPVLFKSVGCAAWDLAAARVAWRAIG